MLVQADRRAPEFVREGRGGSVRISSSPSRMLPETRFLMLQTPLSGVPGPRPDWSAFLTLACKAGASMMPTALVDLAALDGKEGHTEGVRGLAFEERPRL